ncbi:hypothetical protein DTO212C5_6203 [Paecilomyces variotii]|nr:hypothetical protein DTO212C5_6203 [Paecilomyces variotii]
MQLNTLGLRANNPAVFNINNLSLHCKAHEYATPRRISEELEDFDDCLNRTAPELASDNGRCRTESDEIMHPAVSPYLDEDRGFVEPIAQLSESVRQIQSGCDNIGKRRLSDNLRLRRSLSIVTPEVRPPAPVDQEQARCYQTGSVRKRKRSRPKSISDSDDSDDEDYIDPCHSSVTTDTRPKRDERRRTSRSLDAQASLVIPQRQHRLAGQIPTKGFQDIETIPVRGFLT